MILMPFMRYEALTAGYEDGCLLGCSAGRLVGFIVLMMEAAGTSEMSVNFYQTTRRNNSENSHLRLMPFFILKILSTCSRREKSVLACFQAQSNRSSG
jgi:hypothetical protein